MTERDHRIRAYLLGLSRLCAEVARRPELLRHFFQVVALLPQTIKALRNEAERLGSVAPLSRVIPCGS